MRVRVWVRVIRPHKVVASHDLKGVFFKWNVADSHKQDTASEAPHEPPQGMI